MDHFGLSGGKDSVKKYNNNEDNGNEDNDNTKYCQKVEDVTKKLCFKMIY